VSTATVHVRLRQLGEHVVLSLLPRELHFICPSRCRNTAKVLLAAVPCRSMHVHLFEVNDELSVLDAVKNRHPSNVD
jgi:hypothetical protein